MVKRWFRAARGASAVCIFLCALTVGVSSIATVTSYKAMINTVLGGETAQAGSAEAYAFTSDYDSTTEMLTARKAVAEQLSEEGSVLLKNENGALPLWKDGDSSEVKKVTVYGSGTLTVNNFTDQGKGAFNVLADMVVTVTTTMKVRNLVVGNEEGSVEPELYIHVDGDVDGMGAADGGNMNVCVLSGALTVHNEEHAYSGINFGVNGDRVYVAEGAAINVVNFGADYGVWNITEYYFHIEGTLNSYGSDNAAGSVGNAASPDQPGTCITGTYNRDLPLEDWAGSSGSSSEDVTE